MRNGAWCHVRRSTHGAKTLWPTFQEVITLLCHFLCCLFLSSVFFHSVCFGKIQVFPALPIMFTDSGTTMCGNAPDKGVCVCGVWPADDFLASSQVQYIWFSRTLKWEGRGKGGEALKLNGRRGWARTQRDHMYWVEEMAFYEHRVGLSLEFSMTSFWSRALCSQKSGDGEGLRSARGGGGGFYTAATFRQADSENISLSELFHQVSNLFDNFSIALRDAALEPQTETITTGSGFWKHHMLTFKMRPWWYCFISNSQTNKTPVRHSPWSASTTKPGLGLISNIMHTFQILNACLHLHLVGDKVRLNDSHNEPASFIKGTVLIYLLFPVLCFLLLPLFCLQKLRNKWISVRVEWFAW